MSSAARVTEADIQKIMDIESDVDVDAFIGMAHTLVEDILDGAGLSEDILAEIERWLTAHLITMKDVEPIAVKLGDAQTTFTAASLMGKGLELTRYGQTAIMFDVSGRLKKLGKPRLMVKGL